jgi:hypothetical protein
MRAVIELRRILRRAVAPTRLRRPAAAATLRRTLAPLLVLLLTAPGIAGGPLRGIARDPSGIGLVIPGGLWISGDVTLAVEAPETGPVTGEIDDLSLLARYEPLSRLALFGELRLEDIFEVVEGEGVVTEGGEVVVERLYAEALLTPQLSLRAGKVFTPFGLWNVISRAPLTWTVEEPAVTENVFPQRATGLSLLYQKTWRGWSFDATAYAPGQNEINFYQTEDEGLGSGLLFGGRMAAGRTLGPAFASLGLNAAGFRGEDEADWTTATGLDLEVDAFGQEITGELTYQVPAAGGRTEHGLYLQDAIPLYRTLYGVLRFEYFRPREGRAALGQVVGLFWRPVPQVVLKADYLFATRRLENLEPGFQASFSLLF